MSLVAQMKAMSALYRQTVIASRRSLIAGLLWILPMVLFFISAMRSSTDAAGRFELWLGYQFLGPLGFLVQFYGLFYGLAVVSEEVENGTLPYLLVRPIPRPTIVWSRFLTAAAFNVAALTAMNALLLVFVRPATPFRAFLAAQAVALLGALTYTGIFAFLATLFKKPLAAALLFLIGFDFGFSMVPFAVRNLTPKYHLLQLHSHWAGGDPGSAALGSELLSSSPPSALTSFLVLAGIAVVTFWLTTHRFTRSQFSA